MHLRLDDRIGSVELAPLFRPYGLVPKVCRMEFGDLDFGGQGERGLCAVVIERKRIHDLVASIQSKRLSGHQLPGMARQYDYAYLVVEGLWRPAANDQLEIYGRDGWQPSPAGQVTYRAIDNYLTTLEVKTGVIFRRTASPFETVAMVVDLIRWWSKPWDDHHSHDVKYQPADGPDGHRLRLTPPSQVELVARTLPGLDRKARRVAKQFASVTELVLADQSAWCAIEGIGPVGARRIMEAIRYEQPRQS